MSLIRDITSTATGKLVSALARLRGGGSALPGLIIEKIDPGFLGRKLAHLPYGVVVVSGTNGKTTTTKMLVELLRECELKVFTNKTGSNFTRGVIAQALRECDSRGRLTADIAVLELDEAHAIHFIAKIRPRYSLLLNVLRDQLDRFGEIDTTAGFLQKIAAATSECVVFNREDRLLTKIAANLADTPSVDRSQSRETATHPRQRFFGLTENLRTLFPSDQDFHTENLPNPETRKPAQPETTNVKPEASVTLTALKNQDASYLLENTTHPVTLQIPGFYNAYNGAAALTLAREIIPGKDHKLVAALARVQPAFGRGERIQINGHPLDIILVKNPAGFRLALASYQTPAKTMIAINDDYADGRDMSWLWDVDFTTLKEVALVSGTRAWEMTLRLEHDQIPTGQVTPARAQAITQFLAGSPGPRRIYCSYTAMLEIRAQLAKTIEIEGAW